MAKTRQIIILLLAGLLSLGFNLSVYSYNADDAYQYSDTWFGDITNKLPKSQFYNIWLNPGHDFPFGASGIRVG
jgi:hypothetical protein